MQVTSVTQKNPVVPAKAPAAAPSKLTPANVSGAIRKQANGDGDGRSGTAALNDGDAAAQAARRQAFDVKA
jgi:hypothetical protein